MTALPIPKTREALAAHQTKRKIVAVENARKSRFFKGKLDHVNLDYLYEPEEWAKIPILSKDMLRDIADNRFFEDFCIAPRSDIQEFWRSGGSTGKPLFYPRTFEDIKYAMAAFARSYEMMETTPDDIVHNSFPLGIHPAGHMWARSASHHNVGVNWAGSGTGTPSVIQLQLHGMMNPTIWMGMPSFGLHLANLAEEKGIDLASGSVKKILTSAEPLSDAKCEKLERQWGAKVFNSFGMTECSLMGSESVHHDGFVMWTDMLFFEVLDEKTFEPVAEGEQGTFVITSLMTNNATPFVRWNTGDIVSWHETHADTGPYSVFPLVCHAHRTAGFFKVRGVNINHSEFEDLIFTQPSIAEFRLSAENRGDSDILLLRLELAGGADAESETGRIRDLVKSTFEVTPEIEFPARGTIGAEFEKTIKAERFSDNRG